MDGPKVAKQMAKQDRTTRESIGHIERENVRAERPNENNSERACGWVVSHGNNGARTALCMNDIRK